MDQSWSRLLSNRGRDWDLFGYDFGVHPINMAIGGVIPTKVTVIGARSGSGKTAMTIPMFNASTRRKADGSRPSYLFFTWELDPSIVIDRSICCSTGLTLRSLNQGAKLLDEKTMAMVKEAYSVATRFPIHYHTYSTNINEVKAVALDFVNVCKETSKIEGNYVHPIIVVDYLNMAQFNSSGPITYSIADFMNGIKQFCNQEKASAVIFAQLSRETDKQHRVPDRADFSDSASIENAADNLLVLYRPEYHNVVTITDPESGKEVDSRNKAMIRVLKGRDYGTGDFLINCDIKYFRFWDINHTYNYRYFDDYTKKEFWLKEFGVQSGISQADVPF